MQLIDMRQMNKMAANIKPSDSKQKDFHLALADYLYKELKSQNMGVKRHNVILKISLKNKHEDKYEHVIIDCLEGRMFLRGKEVKDKYFGRLRRFQGGSRTSDAYHCAVQSATRIIKRIQKLQESLNGEEREVLGDVTRLDLRNIERQDLRKINKSVQRVDSRQHTASLNRVDLRRQVVRIDVRKILANTCFERIDMRKIEKSSTKKLDLCVAVKKVIKNNLLDLRNFFDIVKQDIHKITSCLRMDLRNIKKSKV